MCFCSIRDGEHPDVVAENAVFLEIEGNRPRYGLGVMTEREITALVDQQLGSIWDLNVISRIAQLRVSPYLVNRIWDYGPDGTQYPCWTVLEHPESNTGIAYCSQGFGPSLPWGLVFLSGPHMSIGPDFAWSGSLEVALRESMTWDEPAFAKSEASLG